MKKYSYENTVVQQSDVICYAFSPDLINASERELRDFLKVLSQHFPKAENGEGGYMPTDNSAVLNTFNNAYSNVCRLIEEKRIKKRHYQIFWPSIFTLFILIVTLANTIYMQGKNSVNNETQEYLTNQSNNPTKLGR